MPSNQLSKNQGFTEAVQKWVEETKQSMEQVTRETILEVGSRIIDRTPVGKREDWASNNPERRKWRLAHGRPELLPVGYRGGAAKGSWQYGLNSPATGTTDEIDPTGETTKANLEAAIVPIPAVHYITSNLDYMQALEEGHSKQCEPGGMVELTAIEFQDAVDVAIVKVKT